MEENFRNAVLVRISELEKERDDYARQAELAANVQIGQYNGAIAELKRLIQTAAMEHTTTCHCTS